MNKLSRENNANISITDEFALKIKADERRDKVIQYAPIAVLIALIVVFTILKGFSFFSIGNFVAILNQWAIPLLIALGLTFDWQHRSFY